MKVEFQIQGMKELDDLLLNLPKNVQKRVLQKAVNSAIKKALAIVKAAAPRGAEVTERTFLYGRLWKNIRVVKVSHPRPGQAGARIDTGDAFWGAFYELGTRHQRARPFFGPAFEKAANTMLVELNSQLAEGIEQEAAKLKK